jgi:hypothetical protein
MIHVLVCCTMYFWIISMYTHASIDSIHIFKAVHCSLSVHIHFVFVRKIIIILFLYR